MGVHLFPFEVKEPVESSRLWAGPMRCGVPTVAALSGRTVADKRTFVTIAFEWPQLWRQMPATKEDREALHLKRLLVDYRSEHQADLFQQWRAGADPPDFFCTGERGERGVELTQLVRDDRLEGESQFAKLRTAVLRADPTSLRHLAGKIVYASLEPGTTRSRADLPGELIAALSSLQPTDEHPFPLPPNLGPDHVHQFSGGKLVCVPLVAPSDTPFYALANFELALSFDSTHFQDELWQSLLGRIRRKDTSGTQELLISAGAPSVNSQSYASDNFLASMIIAQAETEAIPASTLERILLHVWPRRAIYEIRPNAPGATLLCGERAEPVV